MGNIWIYSCSSIALWCGRVWWDWRRRGKMKRWGSETPCRFTNRQKQTPHNHTEKTSIWSKFAEYYRSDKCHLYTADSGRAVQEFTLALHHFVYWTQNTAHMVSEGWEELMKAHKQDQSPVIKAPVGEQYSHSVVLLDRRYDNYLCLWCWSFTGVCAVGSGLRFQPTHRP